MTIRSNPPGAAVYVDDYQIGTTPVAVNYTYYGTRKIRLVKDGFETLTVYQPMPAPWYQYFGIDFFSENIWPGKIRDERSYDYQMSPMVMVSNDQLLNRAEQLRKQRPSDSGGGGGADCHGTADRPCRRWRRCPRRARCRRRIRCRRRERIRSHRRFRRRSIRRRYCAVAAAERHVYSAGNGAPVMRRRGVRCIRRRGNPAAPTYSPPPAYGPGFSSPGGFGVGGSAPQYGAPNGLFPESAPSSVPQYVPPPTSAPPATAASAAAAAPIPYSVPQGWHPMGQLPRERCAVTR